MLCPPDSERKAKLFASWEGTRRQIWKLTTARPGWDAGPTAFSLPTTSPGPEGLMSKPGLLFQALFFSCHCKKKKKKKKKKKLLAKQFCFTRLRVIKGTWKKEK